jgi:uncharacterized protein (DUF2236 family)
MNAKAEAGRATAQELTQARGLFSDWHLIHTVSQEALTLLGGGRAVLLQIAHPLIAAGVAEHSRFQSEPLDRLFGTLELIDQLVFGSSAQVELALRKFHSMHRRVRGQLADQVGPYPANASYAGDDPDLGLWVFATLVDSSLISYQRFVRPLTPNQRQSYYQDARKVGRALGIPETVLPADLPAFAGYMKGQLSSGQLVVSGSARDIAASVFNPDVSRLQHGSARLLRFVTAGLLPEGLRQPYAMSWGPGRQHALDALSWATRSLRPIAPPWLWRSPLQGKTNLLRWLLWPD